jgi:NAD(P)-dependent dehydrogenase (short-subunit alcohol dehydrogenase family)
MSDEARSGTPPEAPGRPALELFDLSGRVAVITGGAGMLGLRYAEAIAEAGGIPVLVDARKDAVEAGLAQLREHPGVEAMGVDLDISDPGAVAGLATQVGERYGRIDILINNAALTVKHGSEQHEGYFAPFEDYPLELWRRALDVNLTGTFLVTQAVGRVMVRQRRGVVLNIAAVYGIVSPDHRIYEGISNQYGGEPFNTPVSYATTKAAILNFTRYLATYWADKGIRVNSFSPGAVYDDHDPRFVEQLTSRIPLARMADRDEYKGVVLFLVSDASSYMTGANVVVDGGWTSW